ncbi:hypothetical protein Mapa_003367 [Marchantia paleacea]|nr:hypothetical protein Mapa_003367 [Marchantia paleacea]
MVMKEYQSVEGPAEIAAFGGCVAVNLAGVVVGTSVIVGVEHVAEAFRASAVVASASAIVVEEKVVAEPFGQLSTAAVVVVDGFDAAAVETVALEQPTFPLSPHFQGCLRRLQLEYFLEQLDA